MVEKRAYDNSRRRQAAILRAAARALEEPEKEPEEKLPRRQLGKMKRRAKIPKDLKCPTCSNVTLASKSWVVGAALKRGLQPECKSCWAIRIKVGLPPLVPLPESELERTLREADGLPAPTAEELEAEATRQPGETKREARLRVRNERREAMLRQLEQTLAVIREGST